MRSPHESSRRRLRSATRTCVCARAKSLTAAEVSTSAEVTSFNRVPSGPRFAANRGALPTRLNALCQITSAEVLIP